MNYLKQGILLCVLVVSIVSVSFYEVKANQAQVDMYKLGKFNDSIAKNYLGYNVQKDALKLKDMYLSTFTVNDSLQTRELGFVFFFKAYVDLIYTFNSQYREGELMSELTNEVYAAKGDAGFYAVKQRLEKAGLGFDTDGEGGFVLVPLIPFIQSVFTKDFPPYWEAYFNFVANNSGIVKDAGIVVPIDTIRQLIIQAESIILQYPDVYLTAELESELEWLLFLYIVGIDNTSPFDYDDDGDGKYALLPEFKGSYEKFIKENTSSIAYPLIAHFYEYYKKSNFALTNAKREALRDVFEQKMEELKGKKK